MKTATTTTIPTIRTTRRWATTYDYGNRRHHPLRPSRPYPRAGRHRRIPRLPPTYPHHWYLSISIYPFIHPELWVCKLLGKQHQQRAGANKHNCKPLPFIIVILTTTTTTTTTTTIIIIICRHRPNPQRGASNERKNTTPIRSASSSSDNHQLINPTAPDKHTCARKHKHNKHKNHHPPTSHHIHKAEALFIVFLGSAVLLGLQVRLKGRLPGASRTGNIFFPRGSGSAW